MGNRRTKHKSKAPEYGAARRDVMLSERPYLQELKRTRKQAIRDTRHASRRTKSIYRGLGHELRPLGGKFDNQAQDISQGLQSDLGQFESHLGSTVPGVPQSEITAGTGLFGTIGAGSLEDLASQRSRNNAYNTSTQRQGSMESAIARRNYQVDLHDTLKDIGQQRLDLLRSTPQQIQARMDQLRQIAFDQMMAQKQFGLSAQSAALAQQQAAMQNQSSAAYSQLLGGLTPQQIAALFGGG
jgi:hypothetical protein